MITADDVAAFRDVNGRRVPVNEAERSARAAERRAALEAPPAPRPPTAAELLAALKAKGLLSDADIEAVREA